jgi:hypothetical protein
MKAIKITTTNIDMLASRYTIDKLDYEDRLPIGYILVTDFGNDDTFDVLTQENFDVAFTMGLELANGFFEVTVL